jgi:hypothetical protein
MNTEIEIQDTRTRAAIEWARALKKNHDLDIHAANETLLAFQFNQLLEAITFDSIKTETEAKPKEFLDVARTMIEQSGERTKREKLELESRVYRDQVAEQKRKLQETLAAGKTERGLSPEALREMEEAMAQL